MNKSCEMLHRHRYFGREFIGVHLCPSVVFLLPLIAYVVSAASVELVVDASKPDGEINLTRYALGQGGLSDKPMFEAHVEQVAQLHPQTIRIFVQEFFDLYPEHGRHQWRK